MITLTTAEVSGWVGTVLWPLMRIGAMVGVAPIFGVSSVPMRVRVVLVLALTWIIVPVIPPPPAVDPLSAEGLLITVQQLLIGAATGFLLQLVFGAMVIAGQSIALGSGLSFAAVVDPQSGVQVPVVSQFYAITATLLFLAMNGHLVLIKVLADSFRTLPVGPAGLSRADLWQIATWGSQMFAGAVAIALPAVISLLLVNVAFGMITKAAPQMNIFAVGFPITIMVGFVLIMLTLPGLEQHLDQLTLEAFGVLTRMLGGSP